MVAGEWRGSGGGDGGGGSDDHDDDDDDLVDICRKSQNGLRDEI
jgi:hypothetical protein